MRKFIEFPVNGEVISIEEIVSNITDFETSVKEINEFFRMRKGNRYNMPSIKLYHGTSSEFDIENEGIFTTTTKRRNSYQSESGFVYLSMYKDSSKSFGDIGYPNSKSTTVYEVHIPLNLLLPDLDQLRNKRLHSSSLIGNSIGESFVFGNGARVKGNIPVYMIKDKFLYLKK